MLSTFTICFAIWTRATVEMASNGVKENACASMFPMHYADAQRTAPPFELQVSSVRYTSATNISVLLKSNEISGFKGFLCQPRRDLNKYITYGTLTPRGDVRMTNNCEKAASLSHTNASRKSSVSFTWTSPELNSGNIIIICTVVQQFNIFWTNITSPVISFSDAITTRSSFATQTNSISTNNTMSTLTLGQTNLTMPTIKSFSVTSVPTVSQTISTKTFEPFIPGNETTNVPVFTTSEISSGNIPVHFSILICTLLHVLTTILI